VIRPGRRSTTLDYSSGPPDGPPPTYSEIGPSSVPQTVTSRTSFAPLVEAEVAYGSNSNAAIC
jgi:hypothetical protein